MEQAAQSVAYEYQILRYRHDVATGEFANVGLVYFDPAARVLKVEVVDKYRRLSEFFGQVQGTALLRTLRGIKYELQKTAERLQNELDFARPAAVADITRAVLPPDDNALFFSETFRGWHFEHDLAFAELFDRILRRYLDPSTERHDDAYAWKSIYKQHFDRLGITPRLEAAQVKTPLDTFDFDKTCRNGVLHCLQSLSFDLADDARVKDKIYRWAGKIDELAQANEPIKLYLLAATPQDAQLLTLLEQKLNGQHGQIEARVVHENQADGVAREIFAALEAHG